MRVVEANQDRLVAWLAPGSEVMYWATEDGRDPRSLPLEARFRNRLTTASRRWKGEGILRVIMRDAPVQLVHFWHADGQFRGWYFNFESPITKVGTVLDTRDWHLDLWVDPDLRATLKDEEEAEAAVAAGHLSESELQLARSLAQSIAGDPRQWLIDAGDWSGFRPDSTWGPMALPVDWTVL